jgi:hypothetical protein
MKLNDAEIEEWHQIVYRQREKYRRFIQSILCGVPTIYGMASGYRQYTLKEIKKGAEELLSND